MRWPRLKEEYGDVAEIIDKYDYDLTLNNIQRIDDVSNGEINRIVPLSANVIIVNSVHDMEIWDISVPQKIGRLIGHQNTIKEIVIFQNQIISTSFDNTIKFWDILTYKCIKTINIKEHISQIKVLNSTHLIWATWSSITIYTDEEYTQIFKGEMIYTLQIVNSTMFMFSTKTEIKLWDISSNCIKATFSQDTVYCISHISGDKFVSGDSNGNILLWRDKISSSLFSKEGPENYVRTLNTVTDNIIVETDNKDIKILDMEGKQKSQINKKSRKSKYIILPNGMICLLYYLGIVKLYDLDTFTVPHYMYIQLKYNDHLNTAIAHNGKLIIGTRSGHLIISQ